MHTLARVISLVFYPLFIINLLPLLVLSKATGNSMEGLFWSCYSLTFSFLMGVFIYIGVKRGFFSDIDVSDKSQRGLLYRGAFILLVLFVVGLFLLHAPSEMFTLVSGALISLIALRILTKYTKASIHTATTSAFSLLVGFLYGGVFHLLVLLIPVIIWARVKTGRHTFQQTLAGALIGILIPTLFFIFGLLP